MSIFIICKPQTMGSVKLTLLFDNAVIFAQTKVDKSPQGSDYEFLTNYAAPGGCKKTNNLI